MLPKSIKAGDRRGSVMLAMVYRRQRKKGELADGNRHNQKRFMEKNVDCSSGNSLLL